MERNTAIAFVQLLFPLCRQFLQHPVDVVFRLAQETSLVLLNGGGFDAPEWSIRCSLANLKREDYVRIGEGIASILHSYADKWKESLKE